MEKKKFLSLLSNETKNRISKLTENDPVKKDLIYSVGSESLDEVCIAKFEELINTDSFKNLLLVRKNNSPGRISSLLHSIFRRVFFEVPIGILEEIVRALGEKEFIHVERTFYMVPPDPEGYKEFEKCFFRTFEQNPSLVPGLYQFFLSENFINFKNVYQNNFSIYSLLQKRLVDLYLAKQDINEVLKSVDFLNRVFVSRFIFAACDLKLELIFTNLLFHVFFNHSNHDVFFQLLKIFHIRYSFKKQSKTQDEKVLDRLISFWQVLFILEREHINCFQEYLKYYGDLTDSFESFVWNQVSLIQAEKIPKVIVLLSSVSFQSLSQFYGSDKNTLKFLIQNIIAALAEMKIRNFNVTLSRIVLKLLLGLKVERNFLKRRAVFFHVLKSTTSSVRIELEVIRFIFFEYIFIASRTVKSDYFIEFTKFCDDDHRAFCQIIDGESREILQKKSFDKKKFFTPLIDRIRDIVWKPYLVKFENSYFFQQVQSVSVSIDREDDVIGQLDFVEKDEIIPYCNSLLDVFKNRPEYIGEALMADYWYRLTLPDALPYALTSIMTLVGAIDILEGQSGAYTDGKTIFLPGYLNRFKDPLEPIIQNRNLTLYIGMALHEASHILAGSFRFNMNFYWSRLEKPNLFHEIYNVLEDFRIEEFLRRIHAHPQVFDILLSMNEFLSFQNIRNGMNLFRSFFMFMSDEASGVNINLKTQSWYNEYLEIIFRQSVNTGRFRNLKELFSYGVDRLTNLEIGNPLAVYPLVREMYEICKHWPDSFFEEPENAEKNFKGCHEIKEDAVSSKSLTESELKDLYRTYNENPEQFLRSHGLKVFPEVLSEGTGEKNEDEADKASKQEIFADEIVNSEVRENYLDNGTVDFSHRTKADNLSAEEKLLDRREFKPNEGERKARKKPVKKKKKYVYSIDPKTSSRTKISEIREFLVSGIDTEFMKYFRNWDFISIKVFKMLSSILPNLQEDLDNSAFDGELNMEILTETLSDRARVGVTEIFDIFTENKRSLEVIVGLDASGSTFRPVDSGMTIFDIEKIFAIIFARALRYLTDKVRVYSFDSVTSTNVYKAVTIDSVSSFKIGAANRDGDFVRYINHELLKSNAERKYFFLISDGQPMADNYFGKEALDDTLISFRESKNAGIKLIYFNVDTERQDYFEAFKKEATFAEYFSHPEELLPIIPELVKTIALSIL